MSLEALPKPHLSETKAGRARRWGRGDPFISYETITLFLPTIDIALILMSAILAPILVAEFYLPPSQSSLKSLYGLAIVASGIYAFRMRDLNHYQTHSLRSGGVETRLIVQTWIASVLVMLSLIYMFQLGQINTRRTFVVFATLSLLLLLLWRMMLKITLRYAATTHVVGRRNVMLIGEADELQHFDRDHLVDYFGIANVTRFALRNGADGPLSSEESRTLERAVAFARETDAREVFVVTSWKNTVRLGELRESLRTLPIPARLLPDHQIRALTAYPLMSNCQSFEIELQRAPLTSFERASKRLFDILGASILLLLLSPLLLLLTIAIRLDSPGPAIFKQRRVGFNRREFTIYKFRTMRCQEDGSAVRQARRNDDRITPLGRFLRATSADELPQLVNVLNGSMSLVGPRPHALAHDYAFEDRLSTYAYRRHVKPGITGWAQCKGRRGPTPTIDDVRSRMELDLWYISNWSFGLDLFIMLRTVIVMLGQKNAF